ncbi:unnamed protein product [Brassica oleracea var. botrytis]
MNELEQQWRSNRVRRIVVSNISVTLSLIDSQDVSFHKKLEGFLGDPRVVVAISINPKMHMLVSKAIGITPVSSLLRGYAKVEPLTIAELNEFVIISEPQVVHKEAPTDGVILALKESQYHKTARYTHINIPTCSNTTHQTIAGTSLCGRHQETLGIKVFKGGQEATEDEGCDADGVLAVLIMIVC